MARYVFLGPSLPVADAQKLVTAEFLPPVKMGDLHDLVLSKARPGDHIAVIDGLFERIPAVWHKEILFALSRGIHVYGASSMGALRAAELSAFGMKGVGSVFDAYHRNEIIDDDEVAVSHADAEFGFRCLSTAMVSIRMRIADLVAENVLDPALAQHLIEKAKNRNYAERHWHDIIAWSRKSGLNEDCLAKLTDAGSRPDAKARDAIELLSHLSTLDDTASPFEPAFTFNETSYWRGLQNSRTISSDQHRLNRVVDDHEELEAVRHYRAGGKHRNAVFDEAICNLVASRQTGQKPDKNGYQFALNTIAHRNDLKDRNAVAQWRQVQNIGDAQWQALLELVVQRSNLSPYDNAEFDLCFLSAMKLSGLFGQFYEQWQKAKDGPAIDNAILQKWYEERHGLMLPDPETHARNLGFSSLREFISALEVVYRAEEMARQ